MTKMFLRMCNFLLLVYVFNSMKNMLFCYLRLQFHWCISRKQLIPLLNPPRHFNYFMGNKISSSIHLTGKLVYSPAEHLHLIVVDLLVEQVTPVIFQGIFDGNNEKNHQYRDHCDLFLKRFNSRDPVQ